ncbi:hypothetical protein GcM1_242083 [Golovinomyces cichoracearum]|uniref:Uncharacterized protein n=1 Tax=Golovinomyces cichoracearum TaxID=62708 RepID=A0A420IH22_9PEZI|nr:hypothetical protein GcM1_242083 [Golovinomyces cichoracearum]
MEPLDRFLCFPGSFRLFSAIPAPEDDDSRDNANDGNSFTRGKGNSHGFEAESRKKGLSSSIKGSGQKNEQD